MAIPLPSRRNLARGSHPGCTVSGRQLGGGEAPTRGRGSRAGRRLDTRGGVSGRREQTPCKAPLPRASGVLPAAGRELAGPLGVRAALLSSCAELCCSVPAFPVGITPQPLATRSLLLWPRAFACSGRSTGAESLPSFLC